MITGTRRLIILLLMPLLFFIPLKASSEWELSFQPRQRTVKTIGIYKESIFIGTGNGVLISKDKGKTWNDFGSNQLSKDDSGNSLINWISIDEENKKIYIATSFGAYYSNLGKANWKKIFDSTKSESKEINGVTAYKDSIYLSTNYGLWICNLNDNSCNRLTQGQKPNNETGNYEVFYCLKDNDDLFLATSNGIYFLEKNNWRDISNGIQNLSSGRIDAKHLFIDKDKNLWAACGTGIYLTNSKGEDWKKISDGIGKNDAGFQEAFYLFEFNDVFYSACASGVYYLDKENDLWKDLSGGIRTKESNKKVYWLAHDEDKLYAGTDEGLFTKEFGVSSFPPKADPPMAGEFGVSPPLASLARLAETSSRGWAFGGSDEFRIKDENKNNLVLKGKVESDFANLEEIEPSVIEVQKQALKFASLPTTKDYKKYRTQARLRNFVPMIGFDINTTGTSTDYYQLEKGISTDVALKNEFTGGNTTRLQRDGRSFKQLSVLWNTNQLIYDDEIRDILNQARLTANIKENLLDDVTRIYYQRRKLQLDLILNPPENTTDKLNRRLEVSTLTGQLDSRTGGWFSKEIERRKDIISENNVQD